MISWSEFHMRQETHPTLNDQKIIFVVYPPYSRKLNGFGTQTFSVKWLGRYESIFRLRT